MLISFLLMTAIWTQVAKIDVKPKPNQVGESDSEDPKERLELKILVKANGYEVRAKGVLPIQIAKIGEAWDRGQLTERLARLVAAHPDSRDVTVISEDDVPYEQLIVVMDVCLAQKLEGISVSGVDG